MATVNKSSNISKISVFLVDDHPIVRRGFQLLAATTSDLIVCGEAESAPVALQKILELKPDVAIVDLALKDSSGLELIKQLRAQSASLKIVVFTMRAEGLYAERALRAGANGYVLKEEGAEKVLGAVRLVMQDKHYVSPELAEVMIARMAGKTATPMATDSLSDRELEVLQLLGRGLGSQEIARSMCVSIKTVASHREHIKVKLGLQGAPELIHYAYNWVHGK